MANQNRAAAASVIEELLQHCERFSFFQAVNLLQQYRPSGVSLGRQGPLTQETVRLRPSASLAFPTSDVAALATNDSMRESILPFLMTVNFMGLYGSASPMPTFYTEDILDEDLDTSVTRSFLDLFHHRLLSLFYRSWEKYRYHVQYHMGATDQFSQWMFALIGLGDVALREPGHLRWLRLLPYLGLLGMHTHSSTVLAGIVGHYFGDVPTRIDEWIGRWVPFEPDQQHALGQYNCTLGVDGTLGTTFFDRSGKFQLHIGPLDFPTFCAFLPSGPYYQEVRELVKLGMRDQLAFDVVLTLKAAERPDLTLAADNPCRLGWSTWLGTTSDDALAVVFSDKLTPHR